MIIFEDNFKAIKIMDNKKVNDSEIEEEQVEHLIERILNNPTIKHFIKTWIEKEQTLKSMENESHNKFLSFLKKIDLRQKCYNIIFLVISSVIIGFLNNYDVIGKETSQTLITIVISIGFTDAITTFFKSKEK